MREGTILPKSRMPVDNEYDFTRTLLVVVLFLSTVTDSGMSLSPDVNAKRLFLSATVTIKQASPYGNTSPFTRKPAFRGSMKRVTGTKRK